MNQIESNFSIYPNPSNGIINVQAAEKINTVNVYNMIGNLVMVRNISNTQTTLDIEKLTNGIYFIELNFDNGSIINSKIIKK